MRTHSSPAHFARTRLVSVGATVLLAGGLAFVGVVSPGGAASCDPPDEEQFGLVSVPLDGPAPVLADLGRLSVAVAAAACGDPEVIPPAPVVPPVADPVGDPVGDPAPDPVGDPAPDPVGDPVGDPVPAVVPPAADPAADPVVPPTVPPAAIPAATPGDPAGAHASSTTTTRLAASSGAGMLASTGVDAGGPAGLAVLLGLAGVALATWTGRRAPRRG